MTGARARRMGETAMRVMLVGMGILAGLAAPTAAQQPPEARIDPAVARCILDRLYQVQSRAAAELLYEACLAVIEQDGTDAGTGGGFLVHCRVPGDPEWMESRLVTREQCARANGVADR
jgi:hypothetical protein